MNSYDLLDEHELEPDYTDEFIQQLIKNHTLRLISSDEFVLGVKEITRKNKIDKLTDE